MSRNSRSHYFFLFVSIALLLFCNNRSKQEQPYQERFLVPPSIHIKHFTLGYNDTFADAFWLRFIQDFGYCDQDRSALGSPLTKDGVKRGKNRIPQCSFGWGYHVLNLIVELAPRFEMAATSGPMSLSVLADDIDGATALFGKVLKLYDKNWLVHYQAGYHYLLELENKEKAIQAFSVAATLTGSPTWLPLLVSRLQIDIGKKDLAKAILEDFMETVDDAHLRNRAKEKLNSLDSNK